MKKMFFSLISIIAFTTALQADKATIEFSTEPAMDKILPDAEIAKLNFVVKNSKGKLVTNATLNIKMTAPKTTAFFSTDFPVVEGTPLMDLNMPLIDGKVSMDYLLPIRGVYDLQLTVTSNVNEFEKTQVSPPLILNEVPAEVANFYIMITILCIFGIVSGFVLGRSNVKKFQEADDA